MKRIPIWGAQIPGNNTRSKLEDMRIQKHIPKMLATIQFLNAIIMDQYCDKKKAIDTFTWKSEIEPGYARSTYEDVPYLTPFWVKGSKQAVIIVPGGGYSYLSSDVDREGLQCEGDRIAKTLNDVGISAFVLWYRFNPYHHPIPMMDLQRAVRFVRYHAATYGIDPEQIGAVGFSAGGFQVAGLQNLMEGKNIFPDDYVLDEVDMVSDKLNFSALIYPALRYEHNVPMLFASFPEAWVKDTTRREELMEEYNCLYHFRKKKAPLFVCYGSKDRMVHIPDIRQYIDLSKESGQAVTVRVMKGADHGYGGNPKAIERYGNWLKDFTDWCRKQQASVNL